MNARLATLALLIACSLLGTVSADLHAGESQALPWETWRDLRLLAELPAGSQALLRSSFCPDGCRFDRHSADDWRYLYVDGEEGVIFEESGAGAITRIWMTMGVAGQSVPLDPDIRLRVYLDGASDPVIDAAIPDFFDGSTPPFVAPLAGDRPSSSGGNFSYVPIPYRDGCRVALVGAHEKRIWYQINFSRLADAEGVATFTGEEDLSGLSALLSTQGSDPWPEGSGKETAGSLTLTPGETRQLLTIEEPGMLTALELRVDPIFWPEVELRLTFDGRRTVEMALADFFAIGLVGPLPTRSLLVGLDAEERLYSYFPMPFFESASIELVHRGSKPSGVAWMVRTSKQVPSPASGYFGAVLNHSDATETGVDFPLLEVDGRGKLAGSFMELGSTGSPFRDYLEGDERFYIDRSPHPAVYGTGVEDFFNGGFYFDQGPFSRALHGAPYTELEVDGLATTAAYRLMPTDGISFENHLVAGLESGRTGQLSMRARTVTWFYSRQPARLHLWDRLDLGSPSSLARHGYDVDGEYELRQLDGLFEGEPPSRAVAAGVYRPPGVASFVLRRHSSTERLRLRRRLDAGHGGQRATILLGDEIVGHFPAIAINEDRRWSEVDVDLRPLASIPSELEITVVAEEGLPAGEQTFTAFRYELWGDGDDEVFSDGFESGDTTSWSLTMTP